MKYRPHYILELIEADEEGALDEPNLNTLSKTAQKIASNNKRIKEDIKRQLGEKSKQMYRIRPLHNRWVSYLIINYKASFQAKTNFNTCLELFLNLKCLQYFL